MRWGSGSDKKLLRLLPSQSLQSQRHTQRKKQKGRVFVGQFQSATELQIARMGWMDWGANAGFFLRAEGWFGSWALRNGYLLREMKTSGEGESAGRAKVRQCI